MTRSSHCIRSTTLATLASLLLAGVSLAQDRNNNFLDNLFNRGEQPSTQRQVPPREAAQADPSELSVRLDRLENALRQLTGTIEQLQYRNQQLEMQVQQLRGGSAPGQVPGQVPGAIPGAPARPGNRSDVFDPSQRPNAPGAPRVLGNVAAIAALEPNVQAGGPPIGAPGGRDAGAPLDLSTLAGNANAQVTQPGPIANAAPMQRIAK